MYDIAFIVPEIIKGGGGARNIFRAVNHLNKRGHKITIYCKSNQDVDETKNNICEWFCDISDIPFFHYDGVLNYHDIGIATYYETAFSLKYNIDRIKYPFYFVQDFEPAFFPMSTQYVMAESTYLMGFNHICSGLWCKKFLEKRYSARAEYFQFPIDREIYFSDDSTARNNNEILFFAKPEMPRRCYELGISCLKKIKKIRPDIKIVLFGSNSVVAEKLGFEAECKGLLPTIEDLAKLYRQSTLGLVFSTTNPSLVPYEMMSCGLPVCDLNFQDAISKYGDSEENVFLLNLETNKMAEQIIKIIDDDDMRFKVSRKGKEWVDSCFPTEQEMGNRFEEILYQMIK